MTLTRWFRFKKPSNVAELKQFWGPKFLQKGLENSFFLNHFLNKLNHNLKTKFCIYSIFIQLRFEIGKGASTFFTALCFAKVTNKNCRQAVFFFYIYCAFLRQEAESASQKTNISNIKITK